MSENIFSKSSTARAKDQEKKMAANDLIDKSAQKIRVNFSLSSESNEKMRKKAEARQEENKITPMIEATARTSPGGCFFHTNSPTPGRKTGRRSITHDRKKGA